MRFDHGGRRLASPLVNNPRPGAFFVAVDRVAAFPFAAQLAQAVGAQLDSWLSRSRTSLSSRFLSVRMVLAM